ncbi:MAG TPA: hypothetical protein VEQ58_00815 [Polyangiaceae bacterium]|nr:hypothetical protein [Polyangiaceae bacterium]
MRNQYELRHGSPNPYVSKLGQKGRTELVRWWSSVADNVRVLPEDLAREFPDTKATVAALRLVMKLRKAPPKSPPSSRNNARKRGRKPQAG